MEPRPLHDPGVGQLVVRLTGTMVVARDASADMLSTISKASPGLEAFSCRHRTG